MMQQSEGEWYRADAASRRAPFPPPTDEVSMAGSNGASRAAALRKTLSSASVAKRPAPGSGLGNRRGATRASAKTSTPSSCSVSSVAARRASSSRSGLAAATSGRLASMA